MDNILKLKKSLNPAEKSGSPTTAGRVMGVAAGLKKSAVLIFGVAGASLTSQILWID